MRNALAFVPRPEVQPEVVVDLRAVSDAPDRSEAERQPGLAMGKYRASAPKLAGWLEANVPEGLAVLALPRSRRRRLRTSHMLGRLNEEIKRRTRVVGLERLRWVRELTVFPRRERVGGRDGVRGPAAGSPGGDRDIANRSW